MNTRYMKTLRAKNSAQLNSLVIKEVRSLHHEEVKTPRHIGHSAWFWAKFTSEFELVYRIGDVYKLHS